MSNAGAVKVGYRVEKREVAETGVEATFGIENYLLPVKFTDGTYAVLVWSGGRYASSPQCWTPDFEKAARAIAESVQMPTVGHGIGSDVIHVRGIDREGPFLVKLFYNAKKHEHGRSDEIHRYR